VNLSQLQIIIPVYNEADNISGTLTQLAEKVRTPHTILIIYDFDADNTLPAIRKHIDRHDSKNITLIKNKYGSGVLNAIKTGFESCTEGVALVVMADTSDDISIIDAMYEKMGQGYDLVCGSRYMKGGRQIGGPVLKKLMTWSAGVSLHLLTGIPTHDVSNSFKMYRVSLFRDIRIESAGGFEIGMEILVKAFCKGYRIAEIPATWRDRPSGKSRFYIRKWLPGYIHWYLYALRCRYLKKN
jgi:glycosyltransferase involved in cell wall biosynthesis